MKILLHICCGVCAGGVVERLKFEGHEVVGFFYNPNIQPADEYRRRLEVAKIVARELDFPLEIPDYDPHEWFDVAGAMDKEPEGGARCTLCYRLRLSRTAALLQRSGCDAMASTLTTSPHKRATVVNQVGREVAGESFLQRDFKKQDGFKRANELATKWGIYRQNYCGCLCSIRQ